MNKSMGGEGPGSSWKLRKRQLDTIKVIAETDVDYILGPREDFNHGSADRWKYRTGYVDRWVDGSGEQPCNM